MSRYFHPVIWRKQLLNDRKEKQGYCELKEETLDRTVWRTRCGRASGPVVRLQNEWSETFQAAVKEM